MAGHRRKPGTEEIEWNSRRYRRFPDHKDRHRRVYYMATTHPRTYLHHDIYVHAHGPIPKGWHVHHINHDPTDNRIENLAALSPEAHAALHGRELDVLIKQCDECGQDFSARRDRARWCSPACKERRRRKEGVAYVRPRVEPMAEQRTCEECGTAYVAVKPWQRFCSSPCKQRTNRRERRDS